MFDVIMIIWTIKLESNWRSPSFLFKLVRTYIKFASLRIYKFLLHTPCNCDKFFLTRIFLGSQDVLDMIRL